MCVVARVGGEQKCDVRFGGLLLFWNITRRFGGLCCSGILPDVLEPSAVLEYYPTFWSFLLFWNITRRFGGLCCSGILPDILEPSPVLEYYPTFWNLLLFWNITRRFGAISRPRLKVSTNITIHLADDKEIRPAVVNAV